jgi:serine protease Do
LSEGGYSLTVITMKTIWYFLFSFIALPAAAETVKDRVAAVRDDRAKMENNSRWIYNDWRRGFTESKQTGKPLMVVLRCVPCMACMGIDASVLTEPELGPLLDQFVRVRVINANDLDLSLFQFDYDLSFSTLFFNADGTVYGRYGSWTHQKNALDKTTAGFKKALEGALEIHKAYPGNKDALAGKQGAPMPVKDPLQLPELAGKYKRTLDWQDKVVQSCVHCHQVGEAVRSYYRDQNMAIPTKWIYPMPAPETIGLTLAPEDIARVQAVSAGSLAAKAGIQKGDEFISIGGQPLLSVADFAWALHNAPDSGALPARVKRDGTEQTISLPLPANWRMDADISHRVGTWSMRAMAQGGLFLEDLSDEDRAKRGLTKNQMALFVKHAGEYGKHAAAKKAGFQKEDVLLQVDGISDRISESELIGRLLVKHAPGEKVAAIALRGQERLNLSLPIQ